MADRGNRTPEMAKRVLANANRSVLPDALNSTWVQDALQVAREHIAAHEAMDGAYATCEGAGGHYKAALENVQGYLADYFWPPNQRPLPPPLDFAPLQAQVNQADHRAGPREGVTMPDETWLGLNSTVETLPDSDIGEGPAVRISTGPRVAVLTGALVHRLAGMVR